MSAVQRHSRQFAHPRGRRRGVALLMVLMVIAVSSVLGMAYLGTSSLQMQTAENLVLAERARYLAESGAVHGAALLEGDISAISSSANTPSGPYQADGTSDSYRIYATSLGNGRYTITSVATVEGLSRTAQITVQRSSPYPQSVITMGPKCYYRFGESAGNVAIDQMGYRHGMYHYGATRTSPSPISADQDTAASFDGYYDHVDLGQNLKFVGPGITVTAWIYAPNWSEKDGRILDQKDDQLELRTDEAGGEYVLKFKVELSSGKKDLKADGSPLPAGQWVFVAAVADGEALRIYQNGVQVAYKEQPGSVKIDKDDKEWAIGGEADNPGGHDWNGKIDEVAIFKRGLSAAEIQALYSNAQEASVTIISWDR